MNPSTPAIEIKTLSYAYGHAEAVHDLSLTVQPGRCYGLFGRNGAGKTTTMKCLLNLLRPQREQVRVFGLDPAKHEVNVKRLLSYVPDQVAFYPWMTVRETLDYLASFRAHWDRKTEQELFERFQLDPAPTHRKSLKGPANPGSVDRRGLPGDGLVGARRTDVGPGPHRPPRVHRGGDRRVPAGRCGPTHDSGFHAPHHRIRGVN